MFYILLQLERIEKNTIFTISKASLLTRWRYFT